MSKARMFGMVRKQQPQQKDTIRWLKVQAVQGKRKQSVFTQLRKEMECGRKKQLCKVLTQFEQDGEQFDC